MSIAERTAEILAQWEAEEAAEEARLKAHAEWVDYMVNVERIRPDTLPCVHGTAFWPDRGQVCTGCEADAEAIAYEDRTPEEIDADRHRAAVAQATREAEAAATPLWADCPF